MQPGQDADGFPEAKIPPKSAVLPSSVWKITNIIISSLAVLFPFAFWGEHISAMHHV
jgi:hypothetical protein